MRMTRREWLIGAAGLAMGGLSSVPAFAGLEETRTIGGPAFGTYWRATLPEWLDADTATSAITAIIADVDGVMSPFRRDSAVSRFNAAATIDWVDVPQSLSALVAEALAIADLSAGAFDPTIGPLVGRYGFGPIAGHWSEESVGVAARAGALRKTRPDATLDLCGIAKGHALDRMVDALAELEISDFLIELGGEVRGLGQHPVGRPWHAGIENPVQPGPAFQRVLDLGGLALATSGTAANSYVVDGVRYSHLIDPRTARPVTGDLVSVSVLAPRAVTADGLATALFVLGPEAGAALAQRLGVPALFLERSGSGVTETAAGGIDNQFLS